MVKAANFLCGEIGIGGVDTRRHAYVALSLSFIFDLIFFVHKVVDVRSKVWLVLLQNLFES